MSKYKADRQFTDYVHEHLAMPLIYQKLGWTKLAPEEAIKDELDKHDGVDHLFLNSQGDRVWTQERFRDSKYQHFNDFTLRYRRDHNRHDDRKRSEFFKIKADYMVYGITNGSKEPEARASLTDFLKFAVVDLVVLRYQYKQKRIVAREGLRRSAIVDGVMHAPVIDNPDKSSSFIAFDIPQLQQLFGADGVIVLQRGFF